MAEYTETYENVLKKWSALCGIQFSDLLTTETDLFKQFAGSALRRIWFYTEWPETIATEEQVLVDGSFTASTSIAHIFSVTDVNPYSNPSVTINWFKYRRSGDTVYIYGNDVGGTVYVTYKKRLPEFDSSTDTIPHRFSDYIARSAYADWLRAEQSPDHERAQRFADEHLMQELDILERQEGQVLRTRFNIYSPTLY
jgi:hypothetical protein